MPDRMKVLFLCTGNSCRSQMAEGWARTLHAEALDVRSAGLEAHGQNPRALQVMAEAGVDISGQPSQSLTMLAAAEPEWQPQVVVTVCGHAHETCPRFPGTARILHRGFDDPPHLARGFEDEAEQLDVYRRVRDEIRAWAADLPAWLGREARND